jgi:hypothetical protein
MVSVDNKSRWSSFRREAKEAAGARGKRERVYLIVAGADKFTIATAVADVRDICGVRLMRGCRCTVKEGRGV